MLKSPRLSFILRILIGVMILVATIPKFADIEKFSIYVVYSYNVLPMHPINIARFVGLVTPYLELLIGLGLIFGVLTRLSALGWGFMSLVYFVVKLHVIFIQGRIQPCGCFPGVLPNMLVTQSIWIDVVTMPLCTQIILAEGEFLNARALLPRKWKEKLRLIW